MHSKKLERTGVVEEFNKILDTCNTLVLQYSISQAKEASDEEHNHRQAD